MENVLGEGKGVCGDAASKPTVFLTALNLLCDQLACGKSH